MSEPILVTGGTGLAGRHVLEALERAGLPILRVGRTTRPGWHFADLTAPGAIEALPRFSAVIHCAGLTPRRSDLEWDAFARMNVDVTRRLAEAAVRNGASRFVLVSTLGRSGRTRQTAVGRRYVASKHLAERALREVARGHMAAWIVRAASMYGEGDRGSMARLIRAVARGRFVLPGRGSQRKCLCYAGSLAAAIVAELRAPSWPACRIESAYDLEAARLADLVRIIGSATGGRALKLSVPAGVLAAAAAAGSRAPLRVIREGALGVTIALRDVACEGLNLMERHREDAVPLADAIGREVMWLRDSGTL